MANETQDGSFDGAPMTDSDASKDKAKRRMVGLVQQTEKWFKDNLADEAVRNLAYYRGKFWAGDGYGSSKRIRNYAAQKNEIFPIVDTIVSTLAMDLPQVEVQDQRARSADEPTRQTDATIQGRRISSCMNWFAERDELDSVVQELVLHGLLFRSAVVKVSWSSSLGRPVWRTKLPWEVHFDPMAKRVSDAAWCFERFTLHSDDLKSRVKSGVYTKPKKGIKPDAFPRTLLDAHDQDLDSKQEQLKQLGLKEYVSIVEFWDFRSGKLYHLHPPTGQVLMEAKIPYGRPYEVLVFHNGVGRIGGVPDVSLIAEMQRDINELVSARREIVSRLPKRMLVDSSLFRSDDEFSRWKNSRTWEPQLVQKPMDGKIADRVFVTPAMDTTFDFNKTLEDEVGSVRRIVGEADYQRGQVNNIRTAAEANALRGAVEGRVNIRMKKLVRVVKAMFDRALDVTRWAVENPEDSGIDLEILAKHTQVDADAEVLRRDFIEGAVSFRLLPFSPLMEDKNTRRESLAQLLPPLLGSPLGEQFDMHELGREVVELFGWRPSIVKPKKSVLPTDKELASATAAAAAPPPVAAAPEQGPQVPPEIAKAISSAPQG
tara:strand:+ start:9603 stop:11399 length:1797 start_codon:yes stop_codon:yes gene_type:complete